MTTKMHLTATIPFLVLVLHCDSVLGSQRFCGKHLSDSLSLVCGSRGFHWQEDKRTGLPVVVRRDTQKFLSVEERNIKPRGIIQECCESPCTMADLENYCASPAKTSMSSTEVESIMASKPWESEPTTSVEVTQTGSDSEVTRNPQLLSRLQDLRARLRDSGASRSRLVSRRPFFFVRPISRRPTRVNEPLSLSERPVRDQASRDELRFAA